MAKTKNSENFWFLVKVAVVGGVIVAAFTTAWVTDTIHYFITSFWSILKGMRVGIVWLFTTFYKVPTFGIVFLYAFTLWKLWDLLCDWYKSTEQYKTSYNRYTEDEIYSATWTWYYLGGRICGLKAHCPRDSTPMVCCFDYDNGDEYHNFMCETCNKSTPRMRGSDRFYLDCVSRQIEGRINRKEYLSKIAIKPSSG